MIAHTAFKPLTHPVFRALWIATFVSTIGAWMQNVSAAWEMTSLTTSTMMVALLQSASSLPTVFFSLPAGALADIVDRRRMMLAIQIFMALVAATLTGLFFLGAMTPWLLLSLTFLIGAGTAMNAPAWFATTPELVPPEDLPEAVALNGIAVNASRAIGPAVAGLIITVYSPGVAFALNAVSYIVLIAALLRWKPVPKTRTLPAERFVGGIRAGVRYVRQSQALHRVLLHAAGYFVFASSIWALMPLIARVELHQNAGGYGVLLTSMGVGAVGGAFLLPRWRARYSRNALVLASSIVYALCLVIVSLRPPFFMANVALILVGLCWISGVTAIHLSAQGAVASWVRGRALAVYLMVLFGGMGFGSILWGWIAEHAGTRISLLISATGLALAAAALRKVALPSPPPDEFAAAPTLGELLASFDSPDDERGVMVTVEYRIDPADRDGFLAAVRPLERVRRRDGAVFWGIFRGVEEPGIYVECFLVETWLEHLRQHERITAGDRRLQAVANRFHRGDQPPKVDHRLMQLP